MTERKPKGGKLLPCPLCGCAAICYKDEVAGEDYGYTVCCPRAGVKDKVHHLSAEELDKAQIVLYGFKSRAEAVKAWNKRAEGK